MSVIIKVFIQPDLLDYRILLIGIFFRQYLKTEKNNHQHRLELQVLKLL